ncbi:polymer-forming cytoskeletal protein [Paenibacillus sp. N3.4]|uniref:bactofilin family protein n=1 Tax=Paenibacillus sp. N3.4 TaxID=2603222 RepID=UPI0011CC53FE|nr:polymer-forming cytoskeletal protein [Paenibacillus sp. N3.4]TXK76357.1 polymer-forming cytoskeletal protein [Paenibacillus sp. N3.4]
MFKSKKNNMNPNTTDTLIGEGTIFEGRIKSEASIRVEGSITGDIECAGDVIIGEQGSVKSNISARDVILAGTVQGNIVTKGKLTITSTGSLQGNISAASFIIEEGGLFQGTSKMDTKTPEISSSSNEQDNGSAQTSIGNSAFKGNTIAM